ncbi:MAG TPA: molybdopterin-dependent oxidoreductase [Solirubrobacterales bacterium]|nr:molybdopterin-dependent oxidoreductase [Solirubrobacterales bacterium]
MTEESVSTRYFTCPLCEATCGLAADVDGDGEIVKVRGDADDAFSAGFICPKGASIGELHADPDRIRTPLVRRDGELVAASWDEAFAAIDAKLTPIRDSGDRNATAVYLGNPNAHTLDGLIYLRGFAKALGTRNIFSATSVDQLPKQVSSAAMLGSGLSIPIPDIDRTDYMLILGANPLASNGSLMTAPDMRGRLRALRERGGRIVVVDPRRTRTAELADEHHAIRPGRDAHLLAALAHTLVEEGLTDPGPLAAHIEGLEEIGAAVAPFSPEAVAAACGIDAADIRRMARDLAAAPTAAVYARIGTTTQEFGTLASWLVDVLNVLTGNFDRPGGVMFPLAAAGQTNSRGAGGRGRGFELGRWRSRVRGMPEAFGELPVSCLAEEITEPGEGRIRALFTIAGNPLVSTPNVGRLGAALDTLDLFVAVDCYLNETSSRADVVLPVPSPLERAHYDLAFYQLSIRNIANFSRPVVEPDTGIEPEWRTLLRLMGVAAGAGPGADVDALDDLVALEVARRETVTEGSPAAGMEPEDVLAALGERRGPERILDLMIRCGPYGAGLDGSPGRGNGVALTLGLLEGSPHGVDLGPLEPRIPDLLRTASGKVELCPPALVGDLDRLEAALGRDRDGLVLIGRRQLRSNNSWMHNVPHLVRGKDRCTMHVNPADAKRLGLVEGGVAAVSSRTGSLVVPVEVTDAIMEGVVSIPHGWGHDTAGARLSVAAASPGVNSNLLADERLVDELSGNAVLNGIPVAVEPA